MFFFLRIAHGENTHSESSVVQTQYFYLYSHVKQSKSVKELQFDLKN